MPNIRDIAHIRLEVWVISIKKKKIKGFKIKGFNFQPTVWFDCEEFYGIVFIRFSIRKIWSFKFLICTVSKGKWKQD